MQRTTKPFPQQTTPIFLDTANWVLRETIQTKKTLTKKYKKKQYFLCLTWIMLFQKQFEETISSYSWWGDLFKEKQQGPNKKQEKHSTPFL
ncbi:hypothetical protein M0812_21398 [Anaeramoeba flamelloides]|uniref:Uncharacterized protein n=1 Tax=Anaeramoeba flamelloides TaxID=1746091 RepID=A0AAV7YYK5_9EUKA|nr:hypothetical protein M0812_21398 [Anaeramoeba flamelloides]